MKKPDLIGRNKCCRDHLDAARAGHTQCLQGLAEAGRFLPLVSPDRASAGELRRLEVWQAAITTCRAGHRPTLSWLFASGWPSSIDAALSWQTRDTVDLHQVMERRTLVEKDRLISEVCKGERPFLLELDLYRHAMRKATPECLEALLEAGCRSVWICRLAALEGNLGEAGSAHIRHAARLVASEGHAACLGALLSWFGNSAVSFWLAESIGERGYLNCLQTLQRAGCLDVVEAADGAARGAQLDCLQYLLDLHPRLLDNWHLLTSALLGRELKTEVLVACLEFLLLRGCPWSARGLQMAVSAMRWDDAMRQSVISGSPACMQLLYDAGYEQRRSRKAWDHPAVYIVKYGVFGSRCTAQACWLLAISGSGVPEAWLLDTASVAWVGEDMLRNVRELGAPFSIRTANTAAATGNVGALRYALEHGAPWDATTFEAVIAASCKPASPGMDGMCPDWLECLKCLHEHARASGFPDKSRQPPRGAFAGHAWEASPEPSLGVLQHVCDHMGPAWAIPLLESAAQKLAHWVVEDGGRRSHDVKWQMVLYLGRKLKRGLPAPLGELVVVRRERAAALAGVFFKAGRLSQGRSHPRLLALWGAMARLPSELRERIASQAHLIY
eukprot:jgi/Botrbrau1/1475/Bobra.178_3s0031.1